MNTMRPLIESHEGKIDWIPANRITRKQHPGAREMLKDHFENIQGPKMRFVMVGKLPDGKWVFKWGTPA